MAIERFNPFNLQFLLRGGEGEPITIEEEFQQFFTPEIEIIPFQVPPPPSEEFRQEPGFSLPEELFEFVPGELFPEIEQPPPQVFEELAGVSGFGPFLAEEERAFRAGEVPRFSFLTEVSPRETGFPPQEFFQFFSIGTPLVFPQSLEFKRIFE